MDIEKIMEKVENGEALSIEEIATLRAWELMEEEQAAAMATIAANSDEGLAYLAAKEEYHASPAYKLSNQALADLKEANALFNKAKAAYKAARVKEYKPGMEKKYPGGGYRVKSGLVVVDPEKLVFHLVSIQAEDYLLPNEKELSGLNEKGLKLLKLPDGCVEMQDKITPTLNKDLSEFLPAD